MDKYIITITREFGSLGRPIAHALSQKLGMSTMTGISWMRLQSS